LRSTLSRFSRLLGEEVLVNVGQDTTLGDSNVSKKLVQFLIITDGELKMAGNDTGLLVVTSSVSGQLENFSCEVLKDSSEIDGGTSTNTLSIVALPQETMDTADGEGETSLRRTALTGFPTGSLSSFSS
jgi:hypothetical protein